MKYNTENEQDDQHGLHKKKKKFRSSFRERLTVLKSVHIVHKSYKITIRSNSMFRHFHQYACYIIVLLVQVTGEDHHSEKNCIDDTSSQAEIILANITGRYDKV